MFRSENIENRIDILDLLLVSFIKKLKNVFDLIKILFQNANSELCLKLFMDYHGLKLLWGWMIDIDNLYETKPQIECKIKVRFLIHFKKFQFYL